MNQSLRLLSKREIQKFIFNKNYIIIIKEKNMKIYIK